MSRGKWGRCAKMAERWGSDGGWSHSHHFTPDDPQNGQCPTHVPPGRLASRITAPLAVVHGQRDRFISPREAVELYSEAAGPCRLELVPHMGHAFDGVAVPVIVDCVDWCLARNDHTG